MTTTVTTTPPPTDPHSREALVEAGAALSALVNRFAISKSHLFPDFVLFHLALDVLEQAKAVLHLTDAGIGRAAMANTRAAFESAIDILLLTSNANEYASLGSLAYACQLVDNEHLRKRRDKADSALGQAPLPSGATAEEVAAEDGDLWETHHPGSKALLMGAVNTVREKQLWKKHFSGLTKAQIAERVARLSPNPTGIAEMIDAMYGVQSAHAHPSPRFPSRELVTLSDGTLEVRPLPVDVPAATGFATLSLQLAVIGIARRPAQAYK